MKNMSALLLVLTVGVQVASTAAWAEGYNYETIDYPGADYVQVLGINEHGEASGTAFVGGQVLPFIYDTKNGTITNVASVAGYDTTSILGIANSGDLVGSVFLGATGIQSGLILDKNGTATVFDHPDAVSVTQPRAVNSRGLVTGFRDSTDDQFAPENGFIYDPNTDTFTDIVRSAFTIAQGINARGNIVGSAIFVDGIAEDPCGTANSFDRYGWLRTTDGNVTYFTVNGVQTSARGISDAGTIAGFINDGTGVKGFVTELDGTQCQDITIAEADLLEFPSAIFTSPQAITNAGVVVGFYDDGVSIGKGFVAKPQ